MLRSDTKTIKLNLGLIVEISCLFQMSEAQSPLIFCKSCKENKKETKARALCYECHVLLCEDCSKKHLEVKGPNNHHLVDLLPFLSQPRPISESSLGIDDDDFLASDFVDDDFDETSISSDFIEESYDFLDDIVLSEDTVLLFGAQVALESIPLDQKIRQTSKEVDPRRLKANKCLEFSVKRPGDKKLVWVKGVVCLPNTIVVADINNNVLKLFNRDGKYLASTKLKDSISGITLVRGNIFATYGSHNKVYLWKVRGQTIFKIRKQIVSAKVSYPVGRSAYGICCNGSYYCLQHNNDNEVTILVAKGSRYRKIQMEEACDKTFYFGCDIHMTKTTNNIYVPCWHQNGVLCLTMEGKASWFCQLYGIPRGITEIKGTLCVADSEKVCLHLITKEGEYVQQLMTRRELGGRPSYICYGQDDKLYVSYDYSDDKSDTISVYAMDSEEQK
ncbi:hypothetical protein FSP39_024095 [Pinctada imbricata]|uniref:B box-type domain-containing protein n=1 Tax=Pinctada imbricata TaxID=66713 RepID=A0AA89CE82_PINIB|nr:hypothetical protein FSP39_024095 [Pinctada imbricata]